MSIRSSKLSTSPMAEIITRISPAISPSRMDFRKSKAEEGKAVITIGCSRAGVSGSRLIAIALGLLLRKPLSQNARWPEDENQDEDNKRHCILELVRGRDAETRQYNTRPE